MPSSATSSLRIQKIGIGEQLNLWGESLNTDFDLLDKAIAGFTSIALTGNYSLTSTNYVADEARSAMLKFTGSGPFTVTVPSVSKSYVVWNACSAVTTLTTGVGATIAIDPGAKVVVFCDGSAMGQLGYSGYGLKDYIDQAVLSATGSLPASTGNAGKFLFCDGTTWLPKLLEMADISDAPGFATAADIWAGTDAGKIVTADALADAGVPQVLTDASTIAWNLNNGWDAEVTLGGNRTLGEPSNARIGVYVSVRVIQPSSGGPRTLAFNNCWDFGAIDDPTMSLAANADDMIFGRIVGVSPTKIKATFLPAS